MGLAEKRALNELQTTAWPNFMTRIQSAAKFPVAIEPNWDSLMPHEKNATRFTQFFEQAFVKPLELMFGKFTQDEFTKGAVAEGLKKIIIVGDKAVYSATQFAKFEGGVLTVTHDVWTNITQEKDRSENAIKAVEKGL
ncbi:MAG TPA: hypothetical protein PLZ57_13470 [Pseudobdellovibrionaceae bacterium]|nr:hypothetical protein [Pseudobdellovibrionaceae bacterium]